MKVNNAHRLHAVDGMISVETFTTLEQKTEE